MVETKPSALGRGRAPFDPPSDEDRALAREIIIRHGRDTLSYFALRDSGYYMFNETRTAFLSYKVWRRVALVGADPIGPQDGISGLVPQFLRFCKRKGFTPCFLGASESYIDLYRAHGLRVLKIGEECLLRLPQFDVSRLKRKVRRAERHCLELGVTFTMSSAREVTEADRLGALAVSGDWLRINGGFEHGFSMTLGRFPSWADPDARVAFAIQEGRVIGFLTFAPVYEVRGWSLDMMRRSLDAPNGLTEFMVLQSARALQTQGWQCISLNFAGLANTNPVPEPGAVTLLRRLCFDHLSSMFQLKSLYTFNDKFGPDWVSRYAAYPKLLHVPMITLAIIQAEDHITLPGIRGHAHNGEGTLTGT